jgi:septal ring factor EnvC (AmiA/AmiB activator)
MLGLGPLSAVHPFAFAPILDLEMLQPSKAQPFSACPETDALFRPAQRQMPFLTVKTADWGLANKPALTLREARSTLREARSTLREARSTLREARSTLREARSTLREARSTLREARSTLREARSTLREARSTCHSTRGTVHVSSQGGSETWTFLRFYKPS